MVKSYEEILHIIDRIDPVKYAQTRNHHEGAVTRLSPYITRGVITLPQVRERLLKRHSPAACGKLVQELAWREYFQNVWWAKGDKIFTDLRFPRSDWRHEELVLAIVRAKTGIHEIDQRIDELYATGYMHNHVRMTVASVACNLVRAHWYEMGRWMYHHLLDGDPASNFCSWQWVAGTSVNKRYTTSQGVVNACSDSTQRDTWFDFDREQILTLPVPEVLQASEQSLLTCHYPATEITATSSKKPVVLYTPWTMNPTFAAAQDATRVLVIDPAWFDRLPVSKRVMEFIVAQGKAVIPDLHVFVGEVRELLVGVELTRIQYLQHQTNLEWPGEGMPPDRLVPQVTGYFPSFFKYWQQAERYL